MQHDPRDAKKLLLPLRKRGRLPYYCVIPLRQSFDEGVRMGGFCRRDDLLQRRVGSAERNVIPDLAVRNPGVL